MTRIYRGAAILGFSMLSAGLILAGCSKPPTDEINAAQATIDSVKALPDVQAYGQDQVQTAEQALAAVRQQVTEKKYDEARAALPNVFSDARGAVSAAASAKEAARIAAASAISDAQAAIDTATAKIPMAPRWGKGAIRDRSALNAQVSDAKSDLTAANNANSSMDYRGAASKARDAMTKAQAVTQTVEDAIAKHMHRR